MSKHVYIASEDQFVVSAPATFRKKLAGARLVHLSDKYEHFIQIRDNLGDMAGITQLGEGFHAQLKRVEKEFLSFYADLYEDNQELNWWMTHTASRSSTASPLFKNVLYLLCALDIIRETADQDLIFLVRSKALARTLARECRMLDVGASIHFSFKENVKNYLLPLKLLFQSIQYLYQSIRNKRLAEQNLDDHIKAGSHKRVLFRSWLTLGNLEKSGKYSDRNFGLLAEFFQKEGYEVWILPMLFNLKHSMKEQYRRINLSRTNFLIPETYLSYFDFVKELLQNMRQLFLKWNNTSFRAIELRELINDAHRRRCLSPELMQLNISYRLLEKLNKQSIAFDSFIYPFENNTSEKPFVRAVKDFYPQADLIGFQHSIWPQEQIGMRIVPQEKQPLPKRIFCSGRAYLDILMQAGFPQEILYLSPSLRFTSVYEDESRRHPDTSDVKTILLILNYDTEHALELIEKVYKVVVGEKNFRVHIKMHPLNNLRNIDRLCRKLGDWEYKFVTNSIDDCADAASLVVIGGASVSLFEVIVRIRPVIRVLSSNCFFLNPIWGDDYPIECVESPLDLKNALYKALDYGERKPELLLQLADELRQKYFEPLTDQGLRKFLPPSKT